MSPTSDAKSCPHQGLVVEQALIGLEGTRLAELQRHLEQCDACRAQHAHLSQALAEQVDALEPVPTAPALWQRLEARLNTADLPVAPTAPRAKPEAQPWKRWSQPSDPRSPQPSAWPGLHIQRANPAAWQPTAFPGVEVQPLTVASEQRQATMLVRMAAGSSYPPHRHGGPEECYVLSGDLWVGDQTELKPGDFQRAEADSVHVVQSTRGGCLLLIQTSLDDELLA
jgi:anti-sigma factor ChrR (cupin superfamily)